MAPSVALDPSHPQSGNIANMTDSQITSPTTVQSQSPVVLASTPPSDPPPPYPARDRRHRGGRSGRRRRTVTGAPGVGPSDLSEHLQVPSTSTDGCSDYDAPSPFPSVEGPDHMPYHEVSEHTPLLPNASPRLPTGGIGRRHRTLSVSSTVHSTTSYAPSLAHTVFSAFNPDRDCDLDPEEAEPLQAEDDSDDPLDSPTPRIISRDRQRFLGTDGEGSPRLESLQTKRRGRLAKYFRPIIKRAYYAALFHLLILNFPYALAAWLYIFVLTLVRSRFLTGNTSCRSSFHLYIYRPGQPR
jgi:hypothetical protein